MPFPAIPTPIACPKCQHRYAVGLRTVVDVGQEPELKEEFLRGRLNRARCPECGTGGMLSVPLVYHDPAKELLVTYVPGELNMPIAEREEFVGNLVTAVMNSVPADQRKAYFFQPKAAMHLDELYDMVLEAEGVSKEALEKQRAMARLVNDLLAAVGDEPTLDRLVAEHEKELDYEFFLFLSSMLTGPQEDEQGGGVDAEQQEALRTLREKLLERVTPRMPGAAPAGASYDDIIALLREATEDDAFARALAVNRVRLDYGFFLALTGKIDAARAAGDAAEEQALAELRKRINEGLDRQAEMLRAVEDRASLLIMELSEAEDLDAAVREHKDELDNVFFGVLERYLAAAEPDSKRYGRLRRILDAALGVLEEQLPPDARLINRLARAEYPEGTNAVLEEHRGLLTDAFLAQFDRAVETVHAEDATLAEHLGNVRGQIVAKMTIQRA